MSKYPRSERRERILLTPNVDPNDYPDYYDKAPVFGFYGANHFLSNFYEAPVTLHVGYFHPRVQKALVAHFSERHIKGATNEHLYQAAKADLEKDVFEILAAYGPGQAKSLGRRCHLRYDWRPAKQQRIMYKLIESKFELSRDLREKLMATSGRILVESNDWHDNTWGDCWCRNADGRHPQCMQSGKNWLGEALMKFRDRCG